MVSAEFDVGFRTNELGLRGQALEPVNAGVGGYDLRNNYAYLVGEGLSLRPAMVVVQVWVGDDLPADAAPCRPAELGRGDGCLRLKESVQAISGTGPG